MIQTKIISSLEKVFIDRNIQTYPQLKRLSALRGERINFQIATTYVTKGSPAAYIAPKFMPKLSGELAKAMGLPCLTCLTRVRGGKEQKRLNAAQRAKNVKKLYAPIESLDSAVGGKNVIIIDDVVTTGASMAACVSYLIRAGARKVIALSLASTEENK